MKLLNMTIEQANLFEQHLGTMAWVVVIGLLTWNVITTNKLQISVAELAGEVKHVQIQLSQLNDEAKRFDRRLDTLDRRVDKCESRHENATP